MVFLVFFIDFNYSFLAFYIKQTIYIVIYRKIILFFIDQMKILFFRLLRLFTSTPLDISYFGVFTEDDHQSYSIIYNYLTHPMIIAEISFKLGHRANATDYTWTDINGIVTIENDTLSKSEVDYYTGAEFVLGFNYPPEIRPIESQSTLEDTTIYSIAITPTDMETAACDMVITLTSSNTALISDDNISYSCASGVYYLSLTPTTNQFGTTTITMVVLDTGYLTASTSFALTVVSVNDTPVFEPIENQITPEDTAIQSIAVTVTDIETAS
ncbi:MAG: hypothetical protein OMM_08230, partial [Candidatus Magnetoglobus multicellularis str. Araruama]